MPDLSPPEADFYNRLASGAQIGGLFDALTATMYFVKDRDSRLVSVNETCRKWLSGRSDSGLLGETDAAFFPSEIVEQFQVSDRRVFDSGKPLMGEPELNCDREGRQEWFVTTKHPLFDSAGEVIGLAGITQNRDQAPSHVISNSQLAEVVAFIRRNQDRVVSVVEMTEVANMSERQLYRKFQDAFQATPVKFAILTRLRSARNALVTTNDSLAEIALAHGFYDQSAFTKQFRKEIGMTPSSYRAQFQIEGGA